MGFPSATARALPVDTDLRSLLIVERLDQWSTRALERRKRTVLAVPLGSTEQHGPHLPLGTDTVIAVELATRLALARPDVLVTAPLAITASGEHRGSAGTLSLGTAALTGVLVEMVRSADWADGVVLVNGHGGNADSLASALSTLSYEQRRVLAWWPPSPDDSRADSHAGWLETSVMLALAPEHVDISAAEPGNARPLNELMDQLRTGGVREASSNGVLGDPTSASAEAGTRLLGAWSEHLLARYDAWDR